MQRSIALNGKRFEYTLKTYRVSKNVRLIINRDGLIIVTAPTRASLRVIEKFMVKKADWIIEAIEKYKKANALKPKIDTKKEYAEHKQAALKLVAERLAFFNEHYHLKYKRISVRNQSSRWGSCSKQGNLSFSYKVAILSPKLADYIIVHELCHIQEFNHSARFWKLVAETIPDYLAIRRELRKKSISYG